MEKLLEVVCCPTTMNIKLTAFYLSGVGKVVVEDVSGHHGHRFMGWFSDHAKEEVLSTVFEAQERDRVPDAKTKSHECSRVQI